MKKKSEKIFLYFIYTFVPGPGKHIVSMHSKLQVLQKEKENLETKLANTEKEFKSELEMKIKVMKEENENLVKDAIEKTRAEGMCFLSFLPFNSNYIDVSLVWSATSLVLHWWHIEPVNRCSFVMIILSNFFVGEETLNKAIEELKFVESEKRENAIAGEQKKIEELQVTIDQLRVVSWQSWPNVKVTLSHIFIFILWITNCLDERTLLRGKGNMMVRDNVRRGVGF